ncbi:MAG: 30S ribosomal protein S8 [Bacteroidota bacterium]
MHTDPIADYLTRVRNAVKAHHKKVDVPSSIMKRSLTEVLIANKFFNGYEEIVDGAKKTLRISLRYSDGESVISGLERISKPGLRVYESAESIPRVFNGLGIAVISTSKGILSDREARQQKLGGEVMCYIW